MSEKKNLAYYIQKILYDNSSRENPLTKAKIASLLKSEYNKACDPRSISAALEWLTSVGYPIKYEENETVCGIKKTNWYIDGVIDNENGTLIHLALSTSQYISSKNAVECKMAISKHICRLFSDLDIQKQSNTDFTQTNLIKSLYAISEAIKDNNMLLFSVFNFKSSRKHHFDEANGQVREYLIKPIKIISCYGSLYLFCELGDTDIYRFFAIHRLHNVRSSGIKFTPINNIEVPFPSSRIEAENMLIGQRERATLRVKTDRLGEFTERFGGEYNVVCSYSNLTEVELYCDLRALKGLILSFGADIEALTPTKLRRAVATELQGAVIKYNEMRKLYGTR